VERKSSSLTLMGCGAARQVDRLNTKSPALSLKGWAFFLQEVMNREIINLFCHVYCVYSFLPVLFINPLFWNIMWGSTRTGLGYDSRYDNDSQKSKKLSDLNELYSNNQYMDKPSSACKNCTISGMTFHDA
jgi:hypothetical protein